MDIIERLNASLDSRYVVDRQVGEGGMARVYLAYDRKHDRKVALKVVKPELVTAQGKDRFLQEIRVTANLQHPHILPLFDSGEADGLLFYVMPYVEKVWNYENGQLSGMVSYSNGEQEGPWEEYYENGQLRARGSLSNGERDGPFESYYENGQLRKKGSFSNGDRIGKYKEYYENGQLRRSGSYSEEGVMVIGTRVNNDGLWVYFHENGQLMARSNWSNGIQDGPHEWFRDDGSLFERGSYSKGEKCGEWKERGETVTYPPCSNGQSRLLKVRHTEEPVSPNLGETGSSSREG